MKFIVYRGGSNILVSKRENNRVEDGGEEDREVGWESRGSRREDRVGARGIGSLREGISKILMLEQGITKILARLNAMTPSLGNLSRSATGVVGKKKSTVTGSALGQPNAEKEEDEGTLSKEYEPGGKNEFRTRRVEMPPFDGIDLDG